MLHKHKHRAKQHQRMHLMRMASGACHAHAEPVSTSMSALTSFSTNLRPGRPEKKGALFFSVDWALSKGQLNPNTPSHSNQSIDPPNQPLEPTPRSARGYQLARRAHPKNHPPLPYHTIPLTLASPSPTHPNQPIPCSPCTASCQRRRTQQRSSSQRPSCNRGSCGPLTEDRAP